VEVRLDELGIHFEYSNDAPSCCHGIVERSAAGCEIYRSQHGVTPECVEVKRRQNQHGVTLLDPNEGQQGNGGVTVLKLIQECGVKGKPSSVFGAHRVVITVFCVSEV
jgi:hypothetical protein